MDLHADGNEKGAGSTDSELTADLTRILDNTRTQLEEEFRRRQ